MNIPEDLKYTREHEWIKIEDEVITIGITDFAQKELGDIVFVELPETDEELEAEESFSTIESVKAASDIFMPVDGTIIQVNEDLEDNSAFINEDPYGSWIIKVKVNDESDLDDLLSPQEYKEFCEKESE